jgi:hypothetical protein
MGPFVLYLMAHMCVSFTTMVGFICNRCILYKFIINMYIFVFLSKDLEAKKIYKCNHSWGHRESSAIIMQWAMTTTQIQEGRETVGSKAVIELSRAEY